MGKNYIQNYKISIRDAGVWDSEEISAIWDFYVTRSVASSAAQKRTASDYGLRELPFDSLFEIAGIAQDKYELLMANTISGVLKEFDFEIATKVNGVEEQKRIDIDTPRFVGIQPYLIRDRETPHGKESKPVSFFTHLRNSFAHGLTYFLPNGNLLLMDKAGGSSGKTTAALLVSCGVILEWIKMIDIEARYYFTESDRSKYWRYVSLGGK